MAKNLKKICHTARLINFLKTFKAFCLFDILQGRWGHVLLLHQRMKKRDPLAIAGFRVEARDQSMIFGYSMDIVVWLIVD